MKNFWKIVIIFLYIPILVIACKNTLKELPTTSITKDNINQEIRLIAPTLGNIYTLSDSFWIIIECQSKDVIRIDKKKDVSIYQLDKDGEWVLIGTDLYSNTENDFEISITLIPDSNNGEFNENNNLILNGVFYCSPETSDDNYYPLTIPSVEDLVINDDAEILVFVSGDRLSKDGEIIDRVAGYIKLKLDKAK